MAPEPAPIPTAIYTTPMRTVPKASFSLIPALGLNADCPCWSWILIILGLLILLALIALALYYILGENETFFKVNLNITYENFLFSS